MASRPISARLRPKVALQAKMHYRTGPWPKLGETRHKPRPLAASPDSGGRYRRTRLRSFAVADLTTLALSEVGMMHCAEHPDILEAALGDYLGRVLGAPDAAAIAVAGPLTGAEISLTNSDWSLTKEALGSRCGF